MRRRWKNRLLGSTNVMRRFLTFAFLVLAAAAADGAESATKVAASQTTLKPQEPRCTDSNGVFLPSATNCVDTRPDCSDLFKPHTVNPARRDDRCYLPVMENLTMICSKTCALCCENPNFNCTDDQRYADICPKIRTICYHEDNGIDALMKDLCPHSCGLCQMTRCKDAIHDCPKMEPMCHDARFKAIMEQQCARTCGACTAVDTTTAPPPTQAPTTTSAPPAPTTTALSVLRTTTLSNKPCVDMKPHCQSNKKNCVGTIYSTWMQKYCPQTCGLCPTPAPCIDLKPQCRTNRRNCVGTTYSSWMLKYCPYTCGICRFQPNSPAPRPAPAPCVDKEPDCQYNKPECFSSKYSSWMQKNCPYTCGLCSTRPQRWCQDQQSNCKTFKANGFCTNSFYTLEYRRTACGRTCGLC
uniref:ShTK domain protein n=1 Tax=Steinernema glaseri TaxID=37863 RepID=A0A1I8AB16_9BILA